MFTNRLRGRFHRREVWIGLFLLASVSTVAAIVGHATAQGVASQSPSIGGTAATETGEATARHPRPEVVEHGTNFAESLSAAFHNASEQVLPSVVTITNTFTKEGRAKDHEAVPNEGDDEERDPFEGTPFGEFFRGNPELRHFFREGPQRPITACERAQFENAHVASPEVVCDPTGCERCFQQGYRGRTGVFQVAAIDGESGHWLAGGQPIHAMRERLAMLGAHSLVSQALEKAAKGITSMQELSQLYDQILDRPLAVSAAGVRS